MRGIRIIGTLALCLPTVCGGCASDKVHDPLSDLRDPKLSEGQRENAVHEAWAQVKSGQIDRQVVRDELKTMAWSGGWPLKLRLAALNILFADGEPKSIEDNRQLVSLMLPREPERDVVTLLAEMASQHGWSEATPSLMRSLSRPWPGTPDKDRPEYKAIAALNPGMPVERVIYEIFLNPPVEGGAFGITPAERVRMDAWDLLARVDPSGKARAEMLLDDRAPATGPVADMRASLVDLRCLPVTGEELRWLTSMHDQSDPAKRQWWKQTSSVIGALSQEKGSKLQLRHLEAIRWASVHHPEWIAASREQLLLTLRECLGGRKMYQRRANTHEQWHPVSERLQDWEPRLGWADLVAILASDEAIHDPAVQRALFAQADMDRQDRTAEYGGLIRAGPDLLPAGAPPWAAVLYPPRPGNRRGDREFVASSDMIAQGDQALDHYHFHVQDAHNSEYAGPSLGDLTYAARMGRTCLVFTSIDSDVLDADLYQPDGAVIDLGAIHAPPEEPAGR